MQSDRRSDRRKPPASNSLILNPDARNTFCTSNVLFYRHSYNKSGGLMPRRLTFLIIAALMALAAATMLAQSGGSPELKNWTAAEDHQNMMSQLGIRKLRPGPSGNESAPNHANYDEATANPFPNLPDVLTLKNAGKVASPEMWWNQRRSEIVDDFDREVLGRVPKNVPKVTWTVT